MLELARGIEPPTSAVIVQDFEGVAVDYPGYSSEKSAARQGCSMSQAASRKASVTRSTRRMRLQVLTDYFCFASIKTFDCDGINSENRSLPAISVGLDSCAWQNSFSVIFN